MQNRLDKEYKYEYNFMYQTLQQLDQDGNIISSMQMPVSDLHKLSFLDWMTDMENLQKFSSEGNNT